MSGAVSKAGDIIEDAGDWVGDKIEDAGDWVGDKVEDTVDFIGDTSELLVTGVKALFGGIKAPSVPTDGGSTSTSDELGGKARERQADAPDNAPGGGRQGDIGGGTLLTVGGEEEQKKNPMKKTLLGE